MTDHGGAASPRTEAGKRLLAGHGHRPVEDDEPGTPDNVWCAADDEEWPCPFAQNLAAIEAEAAQEAPAPEGLRAENERLRAAVIEGDRRIAALMQRIHPTLDGYCPACGGGCLIGFGNSRARDAVRP